jgi:hypothetical protein
MKPSTEAAVRLHRNAVRDRPDSLSAFKWNVCPPSPESAKRLYFVEKPAPVDLEEISFWSDTRATNSPEAFRNFIRRYPGSSYAREAMRRMLARQEEIDWNLAFSNGQRDDLVEFGRRHGQNESDSRLPVNRIIIPPWVLPLLRDAFVSS